MLKIFCFGYFIGGYMCHGEGNVCKADHKIPVLNVVVPYNY